MKITLQFSLFLLCLSLCHSSLGQVDPVCEVIYTEEPEKQIRPYIGNNRFLLRVLEEHQIYLPDDYLEKLDEKGRYLGLDLKLKDMREPRDRKGKKSVPGESDRMAFPGHTVYYLPVVIWNHSNSTGIRAFSNNDIYNYFGETFRVFRENVGSIELYIKSINIIHNSPYFNLTGGPGSMFSDYFDENAMNVHLVNDAPSAGVANKPGRRLYISRLHTTPQSNTLVHEFGHNYGLHHTHRGAFPCSGDNGDCSNCWQEPVSRTMLQTIACGNFNNAKKCEVNGDGFCDTPADPNLNVENIAPPANCNILSPLSNPTDNWGATWVPDTRNVMSYSRRICRTKFSYSQAAAMFWELQTPKFNFKSTTAQQNISGPTLLCPNQTYTFTAPTQRGSPHYLWQVPENWTLTGQGNQTVSITVPGWVPGEHEIFVNSFPGNSIAPLKVKFNTSQMTIVGPNEIADDGYCRVFNTTFISGMTYTWSTSAPAGSGVTICSGQGTNTVTVSASSGSPSFYLNVSTPGLCGIPSNGSRFITVSSGGGGGPITRVGREDIQFYPNPAKDLLYFRSDAHADFEIEQINIHNIVTGESVFNQGCGRASDPLDISGLKGGVYLITFYHNKYLKTHKLIKR